MSTCMMTSEYSWSLLDPRPVLRYVEECDEYIVYWNGIVMPHLMALNFTMERFNMYPSPEMKRMMASNYEKIYYSGGFGHRNWDEIVRPAENTTYNFRTKKTTTKDAATESRQQPVTYSKIYNYLGRTMCDHINKLHEKYSCSEMLDWFKYDRARNK